MNQHIKLKIIVKANKPSFKAINNFKRKLIEIHNQQVKKQFEKSG